MLRSRVSNFNVPELRDLFEANVLDLVGRCVTGDDYWDIHNFGSG